VCERNRDPSRTTTVLVCDHAGLINKFSRQEAARHCLRTIGGLGNHIQREQAVSSLLTGSPYYVKRFRGGLVFKAHRLLYHSTLGLRVIKKKKSPYYVALPSWVPTPVPAGNLGWLHPMAIIIAIGFFFEVK